MGAPADPGAYVPWGWAVAPTDSKTSVTCPPPSAILSTFAVVNVIVGVLSVICGHRRVTQWLSCGVLGHRDSTSWKWMWIVIVGLQLGANALIAKTIKLTPGYHQSFRTWQLTLFFTARPRVSWIFGLPCSHAANFLTKPDTRKMSLKGEAAYTNLGDSQENRDNRDYAWRSFALSQFIAEIMLQFITAYTMGTTVAFAAPRGYYILGNLNPLGHKAHMMYSAALYWLCGQSLLLGVGFIAAIIALVRHKKDYRKVCHNIMTWVGVFMLPLSWMATWLFWVGYVRLAGNLYCPPKLVLHGSIWVFFSTLGVILGTGTG